MPKPERNRTELNSNFATEIKIIKQTKQKTMKKTKLIFMFLLSFALTGIKAQDATTATGGDASGTGGTESYSVGQIAYEYISSTGGAINEGVQQPYAFFTVSITENNNISLSYSVYPNPTASTVNLKVENQNLENLSFQLFDINGKQLMNEKITSNETSITMGSFANGNYLLKVSDNNKELKTIKIIKN